MTETASVPPIPTPLTPLIGRDVELAQLIEMLSGDVRLLTITGTGGIGNTRLTAWDSACTLLRNHHGFGRPYQPVNEFAEPTGRLHRTEYVSENAGLNRERAVQIHRPYLPSQ